MDKIKGWLTCRQLINLAAFGSTSKVRFFYFCSPVGLWSRRLPCPQSHRLAAGANSSGFSFFVENAFFIVASKASRPVENRMVPSGYWRTFTRVLTKWALSGLSRGRPGGRHFELCHSAWGLDADRQGVTIGSRFTLAQFAQSTTPPRTLRVSTNALVFFARCAGPRSTIRNIGCVAPTIRRLRNSMKTSALTPPFSLIMKRM